MTAFERSRGAAFDDADVAACYRFRSGYPSALIEAMVELSAGRDAALDLGCGTGKLSGPLARCFNRIDAVDPSLPMLDVAASAYPDSRIHWHHTTAEAMELSRAYDLVCAGASIHWMNHAQLMPRLVASLSEAGWLMVVEGDGAWDPPWQNDWESFLHRWMQRVGRDYDPTGFSQAMHGYRSWVDVAGERVFRAPFEQPVAEFIACQHSRATWSRRVLGPELSAQFDADLESLLRPFLQDGVLTFDVRTTLTWGRPRAAQAH